MSTIDKTGTFRGIILDAGMIEHEKNGLPQWKANLLATEYYDEETKQWVDWKSYKEREITAYLFLFSKEEKPIFHYMAIQKVTGWSGTAFSELVVMDYSNIKIQWRMMEDPEYGFKVANIAPYDAEPGSILQKLDVESVKKLDAKYANALRQASGGPKPKKVETVAPTSIPAPVPAKVKNKKAKPTVPPVSAPPVSETCTKEEAWNSAYEVKDPSVDDNQISEIWLNTIETMGGEKAIKDWSYVRDAVIEQVKQDLPF